jgi:FMN phosphatase YigB (HAD superfamily)
MTSQEPQIDAVVFDLGGVLIDWDPRYLYRSLFGDPLAMEEFLALLRRHGLRPRSTVFIDDQSQNVDAARELGLQALAFSSAAQLRRDLQALGAV